MLCTLNCLGKKDIQSDAKCWILHVFNKHLWKCQWVKNKSTRIQLSFAPGHTQILSHSCGEKSGEGLGTLLRYRPETVNSISKTSSPFPARDVAMIPGLLSIFLHGCEIKSGSSLDMRLDAAGIWFQDIPKTCQILSPLIYWADEQKTVYIVTLSGVLCSGKVQFVAWSPIRSKDILHCQYLTYYTVVTH